MGLTLPSVTPPHRYRDEQRRPRPMKAVHGTVVDMASVFPPIMLGFAASGAASGRRRNCDV